jgi:hypothetical protein
LASPQPQRTKEHRWLHRGRASYHIIEFSHQVKGRC